MKFPLSQEKKKKLKKSFLGVKQLQDQQQMTSASRTANKLCAAQLYRELYESCNKMQVLQISQWLSLFSRLLSNTVHRHM